MIIGFFGNLLNFGHECFTCHILVNPPCSPYTCAPSLLLDILSSPMCWILLMVRVGKPYPPSWLQNFSLTSPLRPYVGPQCFQVSILGCPSVPFQHPVRAERSYLLPSLPTIVLSLPMFSNGKTAFFFFAWRSFESCSLAESSRKLVIHSSYLVMQLGKLRPREQKELIKVQERMRCKVRAQTAQNEKVTVGHRPQILLKQH